MKLVNIFSADDELNFDHYRTEQDLVGTVEQGKWLEFSLDTVETQAIRLDPEFQGWGHQWGVEFWVMDDGKFEDQITGLSPNETYFYRTFASNDGGYSWAPKRLSLLRDRVNETGSLYINTTLGSWEHSNGDSKWRYLSQNIF